MHEIAIRVPGPCVEAVLDELMPIAPHGVFDVDRGDEVELRLRGQVGELPSKNAVLAAAGRWLRSWREREVPDSWLDQYRLDFEPVVIGGVVAIRPQWAPRAGSGMVDVTLRDDHRAFGTGVHPTTRACVEAILRLPPEDSFGDLGCGSGVLSIVAAKLGFLRVMAFDSDPAAVTVARANAAANGAAVDVRQADLLDAPLPQADVLVANVQTSVHLALAKHIAGDCGTLIASGISVEESDTVASAYMRAGMTERYRRSVNEWIVLELASAGDPRTHDFSYGGEGTWRHSLPLRASGSAAAPVGLSGGFE